MQHAEFADGRAPRPTHDVLPGTAQLWPLLLHLLLGFIDRITPFFYILMHVEGARTFTETPTCMRACESVCVHACVCVCIHVVCFEF